MKLLYQFEIMDMGDQFAAVPVGENAENFRAMVELNDVGAEMLQLIAESETPEEVHTKLCARHPEEDENEVGQILCDFLNQLIQEGMLMP